LANIFLAGITGINSTFIKIITVYFSVTTPLYRIAGTFVTSIHRSADDRCIGTSCFFIASINSASVIIVTNDIGVRTSSSRITSVNGTSIIITTTGSFY